MRSVNQRKNIFATADWIVVTNTVHNKLIWILLALIYLSTGFTLGFGHCIGMCGPIVMSLSLNLKDKNVLVPQLLYNLGRIATYSIIGGLMGATGSFTIVTANIAGIQKTVMIFAGVFKNLSSGVHSLTSRLKSMRGGVLRALIFEF